MPTYTPEDIYSFARAAGFTPDQAVTMTAVSLAESGGHTEAHNTTGEDSRGLWQINFDAHRGWAQHLDFSDPLDQARAAFRVSGGGGSISPWTVTHAPKGAPYLRHRDAAQAAAESFGEGSGLGNFSGSPGYGHAAPAAGGVPYVVAQGDWVAYAEARIVAAEHDFEGGGNTVEIDAMQPPESITRPDGLDDAPDVEDALDPDADLPVPELEPEPEPLSDFEDSDHDFVSDLDEQEAGTDPSDPESNPLSDLLAESAEDQGDPEDLDDTDVV